MKRSSNSLGKEVSPATFGVILDLTKDLESQSEVKVQSLKRESIQVKTETLPLSARDINLLPRPCLR
jgi:hypothetical protein